MKHQKATKVAIKYNSYRVIYLFKDVPVGLQTGKVERQNLIARPFTNLHPQGIRGVFQPAEIEEIMGFVEEIGQEAA